MDFIVYRSQLSFSYDVVINNFFQVVIKQKTLLCCWGSAIWLSEQSTAIGSVRESNRCYAIRA